MEQILYTKCLNMYSRLFYDWVLDGVGIFILFDSLRPINNLLVKQGWVFLG